MKKRITTYFIGILALAMLCSGCSTNRMAAGDPGAVLAGASIGGNVGGAIGGLIGESNRGWRGGYRGSAIGTIVGTIAGAAIANAATAPKQTEEYSLPGRKDSTFQTPTPIFISYRKSENT